MNVPCLRNFVESLYDTTLELSSRKKHSLVSNCKNQRLEFFVRNISEQDSWEIAKLFSVFGFITNTFLFAGKVIVFAENNRIYFIQNMM